MICSRCKKRPAVVFITRMEGDKSINDGLCLVCAKELGIKPVDDMISRMGLSDDDLENLNGEMGDKRKRKKSGNLSASTVPI